MPMDLRDNKQSQKKWKNRTLTSSLEFALTGIFTAFKEERNMKKHAVSALLAVIAGLVFKVSVIEWLFLLLSIFWLLPLKLSIRLLKMWSIWPVTIIFPCWLKMLRIWLQELFLSFQVLLP